MTSRPYHQEIDGLRAISVIAVIFFHLKIEYFSGGLIGVDIFFVISGYLITQIIVSDLDRSEFSFKEFYIRRLTRILPALVTTILVTLLLAMYLLQPSMLVHTAKQSLYALASISNYFFWSEYNYWDLPAERFALLHTWSLGVEEQFYLIYPLLLVLAHKLGGKRGVLFLLIFIVLAGIAVSEITLETNRSAAFYFTPLRFYEFAIGGLVGFVRRPLPLGNHPWLSEVSTLVGLGLIVYGTVTFGRTTPLPGIAILVPLMGAVLILLSGPSKSGSTLLNNPLMSWLGRTSYSLYLVHWPIIVFYRYYFGASLSALEQITILLLSMVSAVLLNNSIENRYRLRRNEFMTSNGLPARGVLLRLLCAMLLCIGVASALIANQGWPERLSDEAKTLTDIKLRKDIRKNRKYFEENCPVSGSVFCGQRDPNKRNILLLGDSRVHDMYIALKEAYPNANIQASYALGCSATYAPIEGQDMFFSECFKLNKKRLEFAEEAPSEDIIFLAQNLREWQSEFVFETVQRLSAAGKQVYLLGETTFIADRNPIEIAVDDLRFRDGANGVNAFLTKKPFIMEGEFAGKIEALGAVYVKNRDFFYHGGYYFRDPKNGKFLTIDGIHLTKHGAAKFGGYLRKNYPIE